MIFANPEAYFAESIAILKKIEKVYDFDNIAVFRFIEHFPEEKFANFRKHINVYGWRRNIISALIASAERLFVCNKCNKNHIDWFAFYDMLLDSEIDFYKIGARFECLCKKLKNSEKVCRNYKYK